MQDDPLLRRARELKAELVDFRRDLHQHPELSFAEQRTAGKGRAWLEGLGLAVRGEIAGTHGVLATLDSGRPGPSLIVRADMDALPITEATGRPYASQNAGVMHACGHDVHTTCLMGAARLLSEQREQLRGRVLFVMQPAEESPPGGAKVLVEQGGILEDVDAALALHVHPGISVGRMGFRSGVMLAYSDRFEIRIKGVGGHAARPHQAVDPVAVAVQVYQALQYLVSRENNPLHPFVITVGALQAGTAPNVIPGEAVLLGTTRALDPKVSEALPARIEQLVAGVCQSMRAEYDYEYVAGYPALVNDEGFTEAAIASVRGMLGEDAIHRIPNPEMGGEDFAYFTQRVPGMMFRLGVGNEAQGIVHSVHSPRFDVDEDAIPLGAAALARIALDYVTNGK